MQKNILRNLNFLFYLFMAVVMVTIQTTVFKYFPLNYIQPDFLLMVSVYFGFKRDFIEGGVFMILASLALESHSASGEYYFLTCYLYTFVIAKVLSRVVVVPNRVTIIMIAICLSVIWKLGILVLLGLEGRASNGIAHFFIYLIPGLISQAIFTPLFFQIFSAIDLKTHKDSHSEDEYDINKEF